MFHEPGLSDTRFADDHNDRARRVGDLGGRLAKPFNFHNAAKEVASDANRRLGWNCHDWVDVSNRTARGDVSDAQVFCMLKNRQFHRLQLGTGLDPDLIKQDPANLLQSFQRVALPTSPISGMGQQRVEMLVVRVSRQQRFDIGNDAGWCTSLCE